MREIRTSGLMSGEGKRAIGRASKHRALPRLYKNVLAVLGDFKGLHASKSKIDVSPNFFGSEASSKSRGTGPSPSGSLKRHGNTLAQVSFFRKENRRRFSWSRISLRRR